MVNDKIGKRVVSETIPTCVLNKQHKLIIPNKALTNNELLKYATCLKIPFFRGVFMLDDLPKSIWKNETAIVNLDKTSGPGTHWVCYKKLNNTVFYFDSFGNIPPPLELMKYFKNSRKIMYNITRVQDWNTDVCGHLCLDFLASSASSY